MANKRYIEGLLTLETPLHIGSFEDKLKNATRTAALMTAVGSSLVKVPVIPSSTFRGGLRRAAANILIRHLKKVSIDQFQLLTTGSGPNARLADQTSENVALRVKAKNDLYMGIFGGGPSLFSSGYFARHAYPNEEKLVESGIVPAQYEANRIRVHTYDNNVESFLESLCKSIHARKVDEIVNGRSETLLAIDGGDEAISSYVSATGEAQDVRADTKKVIAALKAKMNGATPEERREISQQIADLEATNTKSTISNLIEYMAIPAGVSMYVRIDLSEHLSDAQVYFLIHCLAEMLDKPIGGKSSAGLGVVRPSLNLVTVQGAQKSALRAVYKEDGNVVVDEQLSHMRPAFEAALASYTIENVNTYLDVKYAEKAAQAPKAAKGKKAEAEAAEAE